MKIAGYDISNEEHKALDHVLQGGENPEEWITRVAALPNGKDAILNKIAKCVERYNTTPVEQRTTRVERDAAEAAMRPTVEEVALSRELVLCRLKAELSAAKEAKLKRAEDHLTAEIATIEKIR